VAEEHRVSILVRFLSWHLGGWADMTWHAWQAEEEEGEEAVNKRPAAGFVLPAAKKTKKLKTVAKTTTPKAMKDMLENGTDQAKLWRMLVAAARQWPWSIAPLR
jgi:hypothetical protein